MRYWPVAEVFSGDLTVDELTVAVQALAEGEWGRAKAPVQVLDRHFATIGEARDFLDRACVRAGEGRPMAARCVDRSGEERWMVVVA